MFGLFKTKPPLGPIEKAWTERSMNWLAEHYGAQRLLETPTLTPDYAGIPDVSNYDEALGLLDFLRVWMKIEAPNVRMRVHSDVVSPDMISPPDDAENPTIINIQERDFAHRDTLIAALARGLAIESFVEHGLAGKVPNDNDWTVELLPAYLGLGAFAANATVEDINYSDGTYSSWTMARRGKLPSRVFGYAMALRTHVRNDDSHDWSTLLRQDARSAVENGLKYLKKTDDTRFTQATLKDPTATRSRDTLHEELRTGSPSRQISAMWNLCDNAVEEGYAFDEESSQLILDCIQHRDPDVRTVATTSLPSVNRSAEAGQEVCDALGDAKSDVRTAAAEAAGCFSEVDDEFMVEAITDALSDALSDESKEVAYHAAASLSYFGDKAQPATKMLVRRLHRAFVDCNDGEALCFANTLVAVTPNAKENVRALFDQSEEEFRQYANGIIQQLEDTGGE